MGWRDGARLLAAIAVMGLAITGAAGAGVLPSRAAGPPFPDPIPGRIVYDTAGVLAPQTVAQATAVAERIAQRLGIRVVVYTQLKPEATTGRAVINDATALSEQWKVGAGFADWLVVLIDVLPDRPRSIVALQTGGSFIDHDRQQAVNDSMNPYLARGDFDGALLTMLLTLDDATTWQAGPPFPPPVDGQAVYDTANALGSSAEARATEIIAGIRARTGAEVVVYTQIKPQSDTPDKAAADAAALGTQWGVGRLGFDDGLVILFDLQPNLKHGQVQLNAGAGFAATYLTNAERQAIYENDMLPDLRNGDLDGALLSALEKVDAAATPEHAQWLQLARQANGLVGFGGILAAVLLVIWFGWNWLRHGRDPDYLDDPSIYMPAPPPALTPATATLVLHGRVTRQALTTALVDLASHGELRFEEKPPPLPLMKSHVTVQVAHRADASDPQLGLIRRHDLGRAEHRLLELVKDEADDHGRLDKTELGKVATKIDGFKKELEAGTVGAKWFDRAPKSTIDRWRVLGGFEFGTGAVLVFAGANLPSDGLVVAGVAIGVAGVVTFVGAQWMPAVTRSGAMVRAMLYAYRRTLHKTMENARSLQQVVERAALPWLEAPDQALVWGVALGLHREVEEVLGRSVEDVRSGSTTGTWLPAWYVTSGSLSGGGGGSGGLGGVAPGLMSSSAIPNFGGMMAAVNSIGATASTTGGGGGGGGGGFGGGGAGGGF